MKPGSDTMTVWVMDHDSEDYVVNTLEDMEGNFDDLLDDAHEGVVELQTPSAVLKAVDPEEYLRRFTDYCDSGWTEVQMPVEVYFSDDDDAINDWLDEQLTD